MAILDRPRHEKLAQELALGTNQADAYERAGYARDDGHASRLAGNGRIRARVREIQAEAARHVAISRADMIEMLISVHEEARANRQMSAAIRAAELLVVSFMACSRSGGRSLRGTMSGNYLTQSFTSNWRSRSNPWASRNLPRKFDDGEGVISHGY